MMSAQRGRRGPRAASGVGGVAVLLALTVGTLGSNSSAQPGPVTKRRMSKRDNSKRSRLRRQRLREAEEDLGPDHSEIVYGFEDGWTIRRPRTLADLIREGDLLNNCLRELRNVILADDQELATLKAHDLVGAPWRDSVLWVPVGVSLEATEWAHTHSLRDRDNHPRACFLREPSGHTRDLRGYGNTRVKDDYLERIVAYHPSLPDLARAALRGRGLMSRRDKPRRQRQRVRQTDDQLGPDRSEIIYTFPDGWTIRRPTSMADLVREGELLENCLRDLIESLDLIATIDDEALTDGAVTLLENTHSLRDADNYPHAVFVHTPGSTERVLGHGNIQVKEASMRRIRAWHATLPQPTTLKRGTAGALLTALDVETRRQAA
jgi:hypothetical protein